MDSCYNLLYFKAYSLIILFLFSQKILMFSYLSFLCSLRFFLNMHVFLTSQQKLNNKLEIIRLWNLKFYSICFKIWNFLFLRGLYMKIRAHIFSCIICLWSITNPGFRLRGHYYYKNNIFMNTLTSMKSNRPHFSVCFHNRVFQLYIFR